MYRVTINGREHKIEVKTLSYEEVVWLAHRVDAEDRPACSVAWKVRGQNLGGTLCAGQHLYCRDDLVFNAVWTGAA
jgi:hypothetical protein